MKGFTAAIFAAALFSATALQVFASPQWIPIPSATSLTGFPKATDIAPAARGTECCPQFS